MFDPITPYHIVLPPLIAIVSGAIAIALLRPRHRAADDAPVAEDSFAERAQRKMDDTHGIVEREKVLIKRIAEDPRDVEAYDLLGQLYMVQGNLNDAEECFHQVMVLDPKNLRAVEQRNKLKKLIAASDTSISEDSD